MWGGTESQALGQAIENKIQRSRPASFRSVHPSPPQSGASLVTPSGILRRFIANFSRNPLSAVSTRSHGDTGGQPRYRRFRVDVSVSAVPCRTCYTSVFVVVAWSGHLRRCPFPTLYDVHATRVTPKVYHCPKELGCRASATKSSAL